jgi:phage recombination protein Bet
MATEIKTNTIKKGTDFDKDTVELIKKTVALGATDTELQLFLYYAKKTGLDPLARQIYFMKRNTRKPDGSYESKMTMQTSIDGFRLIAERSGTYAGQGEPKFTYTDGDKKVPESCSIQVFRFAPNGERYVASVGVAYWNEYCPPAGQDFMWRKMPHTMLSKVAEALALRKSFAQELSGIYTDEEMQQSDGLAGKSPRNVRERAEKWLKTIPQKIISILSIDNNEQFEKERQDLLDQLQSARKAIKEHADLIECVDKYIHEVEVELADGDGVEIKAQDKSGKSNDTKRGKPKLNLNYA